MKRKQPPNWTTKLDKEGLQYLAGVRYAKWADKELADDPEEASKVINEILPKLFPGFAQGRETVITKEMLEQIRAAGMPLENFTPGEYKTSKNTARIFDNFQMLQAFFNDAEFRKIFPVAAAFGLMFVQDVYSGIAMHKFGTNELTVDQMFWTVGTTLEWFAGVLKKRKPIDFGKGRANIELLGLIRTIRAHQTKKLKPKELKQALEYAGYHVPDEEALRLFEWRAKKKGQV
jgi:hypothetical protein